MPDDAFIVKCLSDLEAEACRILDGVAAGERDADGATLALLENVAVQSARMAYGNNRPELLSILMTNLIAWTDHMDDGECLNEFKAALRVRPLPSPQWHG